MLSRAVFADTDTPALEPTDNGHLVLAETDTDLLLLVKTDTNKDVLVTQIQVKTCFLLTYTYKIVFYFNYYRCSSSDFN